MDKRVINFNPGPAALPLSVLEHARDEMTNWAGTGMSVLECSHRSKEFQDLLENAKQRLTQLLKIPDSHQILFMGGGATTQFAMVPLNLCPVDRTAAYVITGAWARKAYQEATKVGREPTIAGSTESVDGTFARIPRPEEISLVGDPAYVHICSNNTIFGTQWHGYPDVGKTTLVADLSSDFLSRAVDVSRFGLIYAGAQKNAGPAGVTIVVGDKEVLQRTQPHVPTYLMYKTHADKNSLYNTPPAFGIYMVALVFDWVHDQGGLEVIAQRNREKAELLYGVIDGSSEFYRGTVETASRSHMNVTFRLAQPELEATFIDEAKQAGMVGLKGHRSVGGMRASIYNATPLESVKTLASFMQEFQRTRG